jgi:DNA-binding MarR family transcriptional regulator
MRSQYVLSPAQVKVLQAMGSGYEFSPAEIAVLSRLLPAQVLGAINALESMRLVTSSYPITGRTGERLLTLTGEGQSVARALAKYRGDPPVGAVIPLPSGSMFSGWFTSGPIVGSGTPHVLVGPDKVVD